MSRTITGLITQVTRHGHTIYGNPMLSVTIELTEPHCTSDGLPYNPGESLTYRISNNANLVYEISNPEFKREPHTFHLTRYDRISHRTH